MYAGGRKKSRPINIRDEEQSYKLLNLTDSDDLDLEALKPWQPSPQPPPRRPANLFKATAAAAAEEGDPQRGAKRKVGIACARRIVQVLKIWTLFQWFLVDAYSF